jgi:hypothetical protein
MERRKEWHDESSQQLATLFGPRCLHEMSRNIWGGPQGTFRRSDKRMRTMRQDTKRK